MNVARLLSVSGIDAAVGVIGDWTDQIDPMTPARRLRELSVDDTPAAPC